jgi:4-hydroxy-tetrahydrodipicolinate synthase
VVGVKEASGNMTQICQVCHDLPPEFIVLSGDDALTLPAMAVGARGVISVVSNEVPGEMSRMVEAFERGDAAAARAIHHRLFPLMQANFLESNPIPVKGALALMGLIQERYRLPMVPLRPENKARLAKVLAGLALLPQETR